MPKKIIIVFLFQVIAVVVIFGQPISRVDGTKVSSDSLQSRINYLMEMAKIPGLCIAVFNDNKPVFTKAFGFAELAKNKPLKTTSVLYGASFSKAVFAYIVMKLTEE